VGGSGSGVRAVVDDGETACLEITRQVVFRNYKLRRFDTPVHPETVSVRMEYKDLSKTASGAAPCRR
jgi:hypothetical protein